MGMSRIAVRIETGDELVSRRETVYREPSRRPAW
jgi:hypothetical protein